MPPKPPFDITSTWSPARASAATAATSASRSSSQRARAPSGANSAARVPAEARRCRRRRGRPARGSPAARPSSRPRFIVFERGSSTARMRALPTRWPQAFERGADRGRMVGEVVVDRDARAPAPRTCMRRRTPPKAAERLDRRARARRPTWRAAAIAASAFSRLCAPSSCQRTRPSALALPAQLRSAPSASGAPGLPARRRRRKRSTGVQQP